MLMMSVDSTQELVERAQAGDERASTALVQKHLPALRRWAHGRLPRAARDLSETDDLVQVTMMRALKNLPAFDVKGSGAFFGYLRHVLTNLLRDEMRRLSRRPAHEEVSPEMVSSAPTPMQATLDLETLQAYEKALRKLDGEQRELVVMRVELGLGHEEIAARSGSPSANAARMRVARALARLAELMHQERRPSPPN